MARFSDILYKWYEIYQRDLPWRKTRDPYLIWVSEVILQQTQVKQGLPYYLRFTARFPDVKTLAAAPEDELLKLWEGLGYYSRARNMHAAALTVVETMDGLFPGDYKRLRTLKGIGDYTAAAVASMASAEPWPVVDGNVTRVLARHFGITLPVDSREGTTEIYHLASQILDPQDPGRHNQAIMEFGALCCTPRQPGCSSCPFHASCFALQQDRVSSLPLKSKKIIRSLRYFYFYLAEEGPRLIIEKRLANDIWKNLYQLPLLETQLEINDTQMLTHPLMHELCNGHPCQILEISRPYQHELTHRRIIARFIRIQTQGLTNGENRMIINRKEIHKFAFPALIRDYLAEKGLTTG